MTFIVIHIVVGHDFVTSHVQHGGLSRVVGEDLHLLAVCDHITVDIFSKNNL